MPKASATSEEWSLIEREVEIEVVDEDDDDDDAESEDGRDVLVDTLFEELREVRQQVSMCLCLSFCAVTPRCASHLTL